jgi:hypothetical protein
MTTTSRWQWVAACTAAVFGAVSYGCSKSRASAAPAPDADARIQQHASQMLEEGRATFRHDTFGSERFFSGALRLHEAIAGAARGGVGGGLTPRAALGLGLKIDQAALSQDTVQALRNNQANLDDPAVTASLLRQAAVVGITGTFEGDRLVAVGIQCALCHSTVDDALSPGIGARLDGWANRDLDVGKIIALAPTLEPLASVLGVDEGTVRTVLSAWGPGKFDAQLLLDGKGFRPDGRTAATLIPPAFGLAGFNHHTSTGGWGTVTYWNAFVANLEMQGAGTFYDPRLADPAKYPVAARSGASNVRSADDRITAKLPALHFYQLAMPAPQPPPGSFDTPAAERGRQVFAGPAGCARCHVPPLFTEPGYNLHTAAEIGIDDFQAQRSPDNRYRTAPLRGLFSHTKGGFYHDGRFATLLDVVEHYDRALNLALQPGQKTDLVEYLKSL